MHLQQYYSIVFAMIQPQNYMVRKNNIVKIRNVNIGNKGHLIIQATTLQYYEIGRANIKKSIW